MSRSFGGWAPYVPVATRRRKAEREMEKLRKKGAVLSPVKIEGRQIARTFWGKAWCDNLESYRDYDAGSRRTRASSFKTARMRAEIRSKSSHKLTRKLALTCRVG